MILIGPGHDHNLPSNQLSIPSFSVIMRDTYVHYHYPTKSQKKTDTESIDVWDTIENAVNSRPVPNVVTIIRVGSTLVQSRT